MLRLPSQLHKRRWLPTSSSKACSGLELLPSATERLMCVSPPTACYPPTNSGHLCVRSPIVKGTVIVSTANYNPPNKSNPSTTTSDRRPSVAHVLVHETQWWPNESIGRPQQHVSGERGKGKQRRNKTTLNKCSGIFVNAEMEHLVNAKLPPGPLCSPIAHARSRSGNRSKNTFSLCCRSTREETSCCQAPRLTPGSNSSNSNMVVALPHTTLAGESNPMVPLNTLAKDAATIKNGLVGWPSNC